MQSATSEADTILWEVRDDRVVAHDVVDYDVQDFGEMIDVVVGRHFEMNGVEIFVEVIVFLVVVNVSEEYYHDVVNWNAEVYV